VRAWLKRLYYGATRPALIAAAARDRAAFALTYHRFEDRPGADPLPGMAITAERFRLQVQRLRALGPFVSVDDLIAPRATPTPRFCLTFDDGYRDNLTVLRPLLDELAVPACIYVTAGFVAGKLRRLPHDEAVPFDAPALSPSELRELARHPRVTIGCHSFHHPRLTPYDPRVWREEIVVAKRWIEDAIGREVRHFAFPYGQVEDVDWPAVAETFLDAGYVSVASNFGGSVAHPNPDAHPAGRPRLFHLKRVPSIASVDPLILRAWVMGMANLEEVRRPRRYLAAGADFPPSGSVPGLPGARG
jgi:peptidoglycan/xylan/chitin deacetylase (PgdA/CDA1 family)